MKKYLRDIVLVTCCIIIITISYPHWKSIFTTIPGIIFSEVLFYIAIIGIVLFINFSVEKGTWESIGFQRERIGRQLIIGLLISILMMIIFIFIPLVIGMNKDDMLGFKPRAVWVLIYYIIYDILFVGIGEELLFRGYLFNRFSKLINSGLWAVVITSLMFGGWHFVIHRNIMQVLMTSIIGGIYGLAKWKIKDCSIFSVSLAHGLNNAILVLLSWYLL